MKFQLLRLFNLSIWWCETTKGLIMLIDSHFDVKVSNVFVRCYGLNVIVIDLFNETVLFNHRGGRSPPRLLNRQSS